MISNDIVTFDCSGADASHFLLQRHVIVRVGGQLNECIIVECGADFEMNAASAVQNIQVIEKVQNIPFGCSPWDSAHINQVGCVEIR